MNRLAQLSPPYLLLLGLLALLVFGSCGGGVYGMLAGLGSERRQDLREVLAQEQRARDDARHHLRGRARLDAYDRIADRTQRQFDSLRLTNFERRKLAHRPNKTAHRLRTGPEKRP